jgi:hypothetical protein
MLKRSKFSAQSLTTLRQVAGRYASKFTSGGREKRVTRPVPSLPKLKCLEDFEENIRGHEARLSRQSPK